MIKYNRKSIRLKGYDYSKKGLYFITINCYKNQYLFGNIDNKKMILNDVGEVVENQLLKLNEKYQNIKLHEYVVMPNHIHFVLEIVGARFSRPMDEERKGQEKLGQKGWENPARTEKYVGAGFSRPNDSNDAPNDARPKLGSMIGYYKYISTKNYNEIIENENERYQKLWHRNYYDYIIRDEDDYKRIADYIINNPINW